MNLSSNMIRIGITGGIGAGKSFVCDRLSTMGFPIFDCDKEGKNLMNSNPIVRFRLTELLGQECYTNDTLNKAFVAQQIFSNPELKKEVEAIVHPAVAGQFAQWAESQDTPFVFIESAILFESGFDQYMDKVIVVDADKEVRTHRILKRDACSKEQAEERINAQMSDTERRKKADYILQNNPASDINSQLFELMKVLYKLPSN